MTYFGNQKGKLPPGDSISSQSQPGGSLGFLPKAISPSPSPSLLRVVCCCGPTPSGLGEGSWPTVVKNKRKWTQLELEPDSSQVPIPRHTLTYIHKEIPATVQQGWGPPQVKSKPI
jgi:hypothetical protein